MLKTHLPHKIKRKKKLVISPDSLSARWLSDFRWVWAWPADGRWSLMDKALLHLPLDDIMVSGYFRTDCSDPLPRNEEGLPSPHVSFPFFYFLLSYLPLSSLLLSLPNVTFTAIPPPSLSSSHCSPVLVTPLTFCEVLEIVFHERCYQALTVVVNNLLVYINTFWEIILFFSREDQYWFNVCANMPLSLNIRRETSNSKQGHSQDFKLHPHWKQFRPTWQTETIERHTYRYLATSGNYGGTTCWGCEVSVTQDKLFSTFGQVTEATTSEFKESHW